MSFEVEAFYNFDTIKSFGIAPYYSKKMRWWQGLFKDISLKYNLFTIKTNIVMSILGSAVEFTAFGYCLFRLWTHDITYGTMTLFLQQRSNLSGAFGNVISIIPSFLNSSVSAHRIRELVELPKEVHIPESAKLDPLAKDGFRVQMHGVEFSYIEGNKVITKSEFQAAPGEIVALVGPSGEGKTTMIRLILGLIRPQEGETVIIASNGKTVPMNAETRHLFAYVPQGNTILSGTIAENMRMVKEDATDEEIIEALKISCAWDFVQHLPDTINSRVGERGRGSPKASPSGLPSPVPSSAMPRCCFWMKPPRHWTLRRNETSSEHHPSASQQNLYRYDAPSECPRPLPESLPCHEWNRDRTRWGRRGKDGGRFLTENGFSFIKQMEEEPFFRWMGMTEKDTKVGRVILQSQISYRVVSQNPAIIQPSKVTQHDT